MMTPPPCTRIHPTASTSHSHRIEETQLRCPEASPSQRVPNNVPYHELYPAGVRRVDREVTWTLLRVLKPEGGTSQQCAYRRCDSAEGSIPVVVTNTTLTKHTRPKHAHANIDDCAGAALMTACMPALPDTVLTVSVQKTSLWRRDSHPEEAGWAGFFLFLLLTCPTAVSTTCDTALLCSEPSTRPAPLSSRSS